MSDWLYRSWIAGSFATIRFLLLFSYFWCFAEHKSRRRLLLLFSWKGRFFITLTAAVAAWHRWTFFRRNWRGHNRNTPLMATTALFFFSFSFSFSGFAVVLLLLYALNLLLNFYSMVIYHHHLVSLLNSGPQNSRRNSPDGRIFFPLFFVVAFAHPSGSFSTRWETFLYGIVKVLFFYPRVEWVELYGKKKGSHKKNDCSWIIFPHVCTYLLIFAY